MSDITFLVIDKVMENIGLKRLHVLTPWLLHTHLTMASYSGVFCTNMTIIIKK